MSTAMYRKHLSLCSLLLIAVIVLSAFGGHGITHAAAGDPVLVNIINTSTWNPPSPDPSGITYWPNRDRLVVVDGEVDEMAIYRNANLFIATRGGSLTATATTLPYTKEPVGIDIEVDAETGQFFVSDDGKKTIWVFTLTATGQLTRVRSFLTSATGYGNQDPEGLTFATINKEKKLFTVNGAGRKIHVQTSGANGMFDGVAPNGDDSVTSFSVAGIGIGDPEGIDYNPATNTLYVVDRGGEKLFEITPAGQLVRAINLRQYFEPDSRNPTSLRSEFNPADVTIAPRSTDPSKTSLYVVARGVDNNDYAQENDGKIYELSLGEASPPPDTTSPSVINRSPAPGATNVNVATDVTATFDEAVTGVNNTSFTLTGPSGQVAASVNYDAGTRTATLNPNADLAPNTSYTARLSNAITDQATPPNALAPVEWSFTTASTPPPSGNLLKNPGFEDDTSPVDGKPDVWSKNAKFTRDTATVHSGSASGKFFAADGTGGQTTQTIAVSGGTPYVPSLWVNIPNTTDTKYSVTYQVTWKDAANVTITPVQTVGAFTNTSTNGAWQQISKPLTAPTNAVKVIVTIKVTSMNNVTVFVDDAYFGP